MLSRPAMFSWPTTTSPSDVSSGTLRTSSSMGWLLGWRLLDWRSMAGVYPRGAAGLRQVDLAVVAEHEAGGAGSGAGPGDLDLLADEGVLDPRDPDDLAALQHHCVLDLGVDDLAVVGDRCERPDEAVLDPGPLADDGGPAHGRVLDHRAGLDHHPSLDLAVAFDGALDELLEGLEDQAVGFEQRRQLPGVDPPALQHLVAHLVALVEQPLDRLGDLELAAGTGLDRPHRLVDGGVEEVDADQGEVGGRHRRLLHEPEHVTVAVELGHAEAAGV